MRSKSALKCALLVEEMKLFHYFLLASCAYHIFRAQSVHRPCAYCVFSRPRKKLKYSSFIMPWLLGFTRPLSLTSLQNLISINFLAGTHWQHYAILCTVVTVP